MQHIRKDALPEELGFLGRIGYCGRPFQEIRGADPFKKRWEKDQEESSATFIRLCIPLAMTYKKNEYYMFFVVDGVNDPVISDPHFSFSLEGFLKRITKSIQVA